MAARVKRQRLIVDPAMQFGLVLRIGWYLLLWSVVAFHVSFLFFVYGTFLHGGPHRHFFGLYADFFFTEKPFLTTVVVIAPLVLYDILKFSHRIAGPLYRCRRVMRDMVEGKAVPEFKAREHDFLDDVFADFNALIRAWNARVGSGQHAENGTGQGDLVAAPARVGDCVEAS
jgi:hypothetical protein